MRLLKHTEALGDQSHWGSSGIYLPKRLLQQSVPVSDILSNLLDLFPGAPGKGGPQFPWMRSLQKYIKTVFAEAEFQWYIQFFYLKIHFLNAFAL